MLPPFFSAPGKGASFNHISYSSADSPALHQNLILQAIAAYKFELRVLFGSKVRERLYGWFCFIAFCLPP